MAGEPDWQAYLNNNPDILQTYNTNSKVRRKFSSPLDFAMDHYYSYGVQEGRVLPTIAPPVVEAPAPVPVPEPAPVAATTPVETITQQFSPENPRVQNLARSRIENELIAAGLDPANYQDLINKEINAIPGTGENYSPSIGTDVLARLDTEARNKNVNSVKSVFTPNYSTQQIGDTWLDDTINSIIGEQFGDAQKGIDRAKERGQFNQIGYDRAMQGLNTARTAGQSRLNAMEGDILTKYRGNIDTVGTNAYNDASTTGAADRFNLDDYVAKAGSIVGDARTNAPGELLNTLGGEKLYDLNSLMNKGGEAQGALNLRDKQVAEAIEKKKAAAGVGRGLGSQGAF